MKTLQELLDDGKSYTEIATILGMSRPNAAKLCQQEKIRRGELMDHIDPNWARSRYLDDVVDIDVLAKEMGCSVIRARQYLQAHGIFRDRGYVFRTGAKPKPGKGVRVPGSIRDRATRRAKAGSPEHREKQAAAKRGKRGDETNHWKGGVYISGDYEVVTLDGRKNYVHRAMAELLLDRELRTEEQVHHVDMNRKNNHPSNLIVLLGGDHTLLHRAMSANPGLDQRAWLITNHINFEDLGAHGEDYLKEAC
jgi:hypothetical protein